MTEEEENNETQEEQPSPNEMASPDNVLKQAQEIRDSLREENKKYEQLVKRQEAATARQMIGGRTDAEMTENMTEEEKKNKQAEKEAEEIVNAFR